MSSDKIKVLGSGSPILDVLLQVEDSFLSSHISGEKGGMVMIGDAEQRRILSLVSAQGIPVKRAIGGSAFNTVSGLTHLGLATSFFGMTGKDPDGRFFREAYQKIGGDVSSFRETDKASTANCISMVTPDSQRTMRTNLGASSLLSADDVSSGIFRGVTHLHIEGYQLFSADLVRKLIREAKKNFCTVSYDMASFEVVRLLRKDLVSILDDIDVIFANEDEAAEFFAGEDLSPRQAAERLSEHCPAAIVKVGKEGAWIRENGKTIHTDAELVKAVDTTGAGDLWQAGFLYGYLTGRGIEEAGRIGAATGAAVVQQLGAGIPEEKWNEIRERFHI